VPAFRRVRPSRASVDVAVQIRNAILAGRYRSGDRLPTERELVRQFGVSRVTVRDALRTLEAGGLIRIRMGGQGGPYVAHPDVRVLSENLGNQLQLSGCTFQELAEARLTLETAAVRLAAERAGPADLEALEAALQEADAPRAVGSAGASLDFHEAVARASHNRAIWMMFAATRTLIREAFDQLHARQPDMPGSARRAHRAMLDAISAHDPERADRLMREHLAEFMERAARATRPSRPGPADG
jgi:GntR family transcriptional repressor for pyruvate dehydrogenase complex